MTNPNPADSTPESVDLLCERWVAWSRTRRLYGPKPVPGGTLTRIAGTTIRPLRLLKDEPVSSAELSAFHFAFLCQPENLDRQVFEAYYVHRIKPVKRAADALGISVRHFYRLLDAFTRRVKEAGRAVEANNVRPVVDDDMEL